MTNFNIAIDKGLSKEKKQEAESKGYPTADFINVVAWGKTAEFAANYLRKGLMVGVTGKVETGRYEKDGRMIYTTDINAREIHMIEWPDNNQGANNQENIPSGFHTAEGDQDLPF